MTNKFLQLYLYIKKKEKCPYITGYDVTEKKLPLFLVFVLHKFTKKKNYNNIIIYRYT